MQNPQGVWSHTRQLLLAFWSGATQPCLPAVVIVILVNVSVWAGLAVGLEGWMRQGFERYIATNPIDFDTFVTASTLKMAQADTDRPWVVMLGGSAMRGAVVEDRLANQLQSQTGRRWDVHNLTTGRQSIWEMVALADMIPTEARGIVLAEASLGPYAFTPDYPNQLITSPRLGFRSTAFDHETARLGYPGSQRTGVYFFDNSGFFTSRLSTWLTRLPQMPVDLQPMPFLHPDPTLGIQRWDGTSYHVRLEKNAKYVQDNLEVLIRLSDRLRDHGLHLVLVDTPINPQFLSRFKHHRLFREHNLAMRQLADEIQIPYLDLPGKSGINELDYYDYCHLGSETATQRVTDWLASLLARMWSQDEWEETSP